MAFKMKGPTFFQKKKSFLEKMKETAKTAVTGAITAGASTFAKEKEKEKKKINK